MKKIINNLMYYYKNIVLRLAFVAVDNKKKTFSIFMVMVACLGVYLWQVNVLATIGYQVTDLENTRNQLKAETLRLEVAIAQAQSTDHVVSRLKDTSMVINTRVQFVDIHNDVALNK